MPSVTPTLEPIRPGYRMRILAEDQLEALRLASLEILHSVGVHCPSSKARAIYRQHGAEIDEATEIVRLPPDLVLQAMARRRGTTRWGPAARRTMPCSTGRRCSWRRMAAESRRSTSRPASDGRRRRRTSPAWPGWPTPCPPSASTGRSSARRTIRARRRSTSSMPRSAIPSSMCRPRRSWTSAWRATPSSWRTSSPATRPPCAPGRRSRRWCVRSPRWRRTKAAWRRRWSWPRPACRWASCRWPTPARPGRARSPERWRPPTPRSLPRWSSSSWRFPGARSSTR